METTTTQYGSHQVMTGGHKPIKTVLLNIDTRFCDSAAAAAAASYTFTLPQKINSVRSMTVVSAEIPYTIYNVSSTVGNNYFTVIDSSDAEVDITVSDGNYTSTAGLVTAVAAAAAAAATDITFSISEGVCGMVNDATSAVSVDFGDVGHLGWRLGFRDSMYDIASGVGVSGESLVDISPPRYLFLVVDDFTRNANSFLSPFQQSILNKNIIAKIPVDGVKYSFGEIIMANLINGTLVSDTRYYKGTGSDLQRLVISLVDEFGTVVDLRRMDWSFVLKLEVED